MRGANQSCGLLAPNRATRGLLLDMNDLWIRHIRAQHPVESHGQLAPLPPWPRLSASGDNDANIACGSRIQTHRGLRRFHQQRSQQSIACLLIAPASCRPPDFSSRVQSVQITGHLLASRKPTSSPMSAHTPAPCSDPLPGCVISNRGLIIPKVPAGSVIARATSVEGRLVERTAPVLSLAARKDPSDRNHRNFALIDIDGTLKDLEIVKSACEASRTMRA